MGPPFSSPIKSLAYPLKRCDLWNCCYLWSFHDAQLWNVQCFSCKSSQTVHLEAIVGSQLFCDTDRWVLKYWCSRLPPPVSASRHSYLPASKCIYLCLDTVVHAETNSLSSWHRCPLLSSFSLPKGVLSVQLLTLRHSHLYVNSLKGLWFCLWFCSFCWHRWLLNHVAQLMKLSTSVSSSSFPTAPSQ